MQMVGAVIGCQRVSLAVEREPSAGDAIAVAADRGAKKRMPLQIAVERFEAERDVRVFSIAVGRLNADQRRAVINEAHTDPVQVRERVNFDFLAVVGLAERLNIVLHRGDGADF